MKTLRVGIASNREMKARSVAISEGEDKPTSGEPKFESGMGNRAWRDFWIALPDKGAPFQSAGTRRLEILRL